MPIIRQLIRAVRMTLILWLVVAIIYPLIILVVGQAFFHYTANGSIVQNIRGEAIGSALIGQQFRSDRYFHSRPSAVKYSEGKEAKPIGISGATNLAPSNPQLLKRVIEQANKLRDDNIQPVTDLVYTSASGVDPHISLKAVKEQLDRVAHARNLRPDEVVPLINKFTEGRFLGIFGEPGVNVLRLNYALDLDEFNRKQNE